MLQVKCKLITRSYDRDLLGKIVNQLEHFTARNSSKVVLAMVLLHEGNQSGSKK